MSDKPVGSYGLDAHGNTILEEFRENRPVFAKMLSIVRDTLRKSIQDNHIYINAARSNDLQCRIGQWGTIVSPSETLTIDTTIYRRMQMEENIGIRSTGIGLQYSPIRERRQAMKETVTFTSLSSGLHYAHVREHPYEPETEIVMIGSLTSGIEYKQTGESPV